jgi:hypothetical protein
MQQIDGLKVAIAEAARRIRASGSRRLSFCNNEHCKGGARLRAALAD